MREADRYESSGPVSQKRIALVVDDQRDLANALAVLLEALGNDAVAAYDVPTALSLAREFRPQLVITDVSMPGDSGLTFAACLRSDPRLANCRLVAMSGYSAEVFGTSAAEAFDEWVLKPISVEVLRSIVGRSPVPGTRA